MSDTALKEAQIQREKELASAPIGSLLIRLSLPVVIAQFVNVLYNMVDRMYIGHIPEVGATALTGVGVSFPIIVLVSAFAAFVGSGGAPLATISLGRGDRERAQKILGTGTSSLIIISIILTIVFQIFKEPILYAFGASDDTIGYGMSYLNIYLIGTIFVQLALGLNTFISSQGQTKTAMLSVLIGAVINIILDPILIFGLNMGVRGAALATIISQCISTIWVISFLISAKSSIRLELKYMKPELHILGSIAALGISPFIMQATESLITVVFNAGLQTYGGDLYVGSMTIMQSVMQLIFVPVNGLGMGAQSVISFNFGAHHFDRVKAAFRWLLKVCLCYTVSFWLIVHFLPGVFAMIFTSDEALISLVKQVLPIYMGGIWIFGLQMACQNTFVSTGQAGISLFIALWRKVILLVPLAIVLPKFFGVMGIYYAEPIADTVSAITSGILFALMFNKAIEKEKRSSL